MGYGYSYKCECGNEFSLNLGMGFFPDFDGVDTKAREGVYGTEIKELLNGNDNLFIEGENKVFICKCGNWKEEKDLTIYENVYLEMDQKKIDEIKDEQLREEMIESLNEPCEQRIYRRYATVCEKCKSEMEALSEENVEALPCPKCGRKNKPAGSYLWD